VLLGDLRRRVGVPRIHRSVLRYRHPAQRLIATRTSGFVAAGVEVGWPARRRLDIAVGFASVAAFSVDDHRAGQDQSPDADPGHGSEQVRGPGDVGIGVVRQILKVDP
jgi:hypothetical protein